MRPVDPGRPGLQEDARMSGQGREKLAVKSIGSARHATPEEELLKALQTYVRRVRMPAPLADDAYRAVMKALGMPEDLPK
jgi:hypothetical protein